MSDILGYIRNNPQETQRLVGVKYDQVEQLIDLAIAQVEGLQAALDAKAAPHPGFISGRYYGSSIFTSTVATHATGFVYYTYFFVPFAQNFNKIAFQTTTNSSSTQRVRIGIYKIVSGLPSTLIADLGEISFTSSGIKEVSCSI